MAHFYLGTTYEAKGMYEEALLEVQQAVKGLGDVPELMASLARLNALSGRIDEALRTIVELRHLPEGRYAEPYFLALIYEALGNKDAAFEWLERGYAEHDEYKMLLKVDPRLDGLRDDPRFESLLQRVGFPNATNRQTLEAASGGRPR